MVLERESAGEHCMRVDTEEGRSGRCRDRGELANEISSLGKGVTTRRSGIEECRYR